ncbi:MAG: hypothetical protein HN729_01370 [Candidatus Marinimicrobia bacterium]|jgi:hypothetical protein|nr:hypothetical protein [Candidatus Neomarinimicrobiota bacterium]MBT3682688.1 hypothetical protein [Candidatus Neomarinimicrobiota bacterium]MBT3759657.1 hypothetical protein [Candidatus Neomarinimicrobiota bacterium]MBT3894471.1 hypothetical protein [Candidatus Neomarinimicrobiota bacterium]MBT4172514.1 hypothetical protein [Candidatus Neomarinimicrobiota bacterium]
MKRISLTLLLFGIALSQFDVNFSLESKYGDGKKITNQASETPLVSDYLYSEHILDINTYFNNFYLFTQAEYSDPPIYGENNQGLSAFYLEYSKNRFTLKAGDLYSIFGRGTSFSTYYDQNIDLDNSIQGAEIRFDLTSNINLYSLFGEGEYSYRSNPVLLISDRQLESSVSLIGSEIYSDFFGDFNLFYLEQEQDLSSELLYSYGPEIHDSRIAREIYTRIETPTDATVNLYSSNLAWNKSFSFLDIYIERAWNSYSKILGNMTSGSMTYGAVSTDIANFGVTYEYKNYDMPYFIQTLSSPPTVIREATSILVPRNNHSINFADEIGHQLEVTGKIGENMTLLANLSIASRDVGFGQRQYNTFNVLTEGGNVTASWGETESELIELPSPSLTDILKFDDSESLYSHSPYRQWHIELNGWILDDKLNYKFALNDYKEVISYLDQEIVYYQSDYTSPELESLISDYYSELYWNEWDGLFAFWGDSSLTNSTFESLHQGLTIQEVISIDTENSFGTVDSVMNKSTQISKNYEIIKAFSIPTQIAFNAGNIGAFTIYWEHQWKEILVNRDVEYQGDSVDSGLSHTEEYYYHYLSLTYRHPADISVTLFYDSENYTKEAWETPEGDNNWTGIDLSYDINANNQFSVFYGSQKGGRVCANGICADQPGFEDGIKLTLRSIF